MLRETEQALKKPAPELPPEVPPDDVVVNVAVPAAEAPELPQPEARTKLAVGLSIVAHIAISLGITVLAPYSAQHQKVPVKLKIHETPKPKVEVAKEEPKPVPPPPKPVEKKKAKPKEKKVVSEKKPKDKPVEPPKPIQGLAPSALVPGAHGVAVPVGNTLMVEDDGKRHNADEVKPLTDEDLSSEAKLIQGTILAPKYTDDAVDANVQGTTTVDVYVDADGHVTQAELRKKVGYGMDDRILEAARKARFTPRKDKLGRPVAGWSELKFVSSDCREMVFRSA